MIEGSIAGRTITFNGSLEDALKEFEHQRSGRTELVIVACILLTILDQAEDHIKLIPRKPMFLKSKTHPQNRPC